MNKTEALTVTDATGAETVTVARTRDSAMLEVLAQLEL